MKTSQNQFKPFGLTKSVFAFALTGLLATMANAQIAPGTTGIDATGSAASEMAACNNGNTQQSRDTCLREVRNANAEKRAGKIDNAGGQFNANALMRCNVLDGDDKTACQARMSGAGTAQGSVAGGGVITQVETVVPPATPQVISLPPQTSPDAVIVIPAK